MDVCEIINEDGVKVGEIIVNDARNDAELEPVILEALDIDDTVNYVVTLSQFDTSGQYEGMRQFRVQIEDTDYRRTHDRDADRYYDDEIEATEETPRPRTGGYAAYDEYHHGIDDPDVGDGNMIEISGSNWQREDAGQYVRYGKAYHIYENGCPFQRGWNEVNLSFRQITAIQNNPDRYAYDDVNKILVDKQKPAIFLLKGKWNRIYRAVIERMLDGVAKTTIEEVKKDHAALLTDVISKNRHRVYQDVRNRLQRCNAQVTDLTDKLTKAIVEQAALMKLSTVEENFTVDNAKVLIDQIKATEGVKDVTVSGRKLEVHTDTIVMEDRHEKFTIGEMIIKIDIETSDITFFNKTRRVDRKPHPHVYDNNTACLGEITQAVPQLGSKMMYQELVQILLTFLRTISKAGHEAWYVGWPHESKHK